MSPKARPIDSRERKLRRIQKSYVGGFTLHGLSKVVSGTKQEKLLWGVFLLTALSFTGYMFYTYCNKYTSYEYRTEIRIEEIDQLQLPSITLCMDYNHRLHKSLEQFANDSSRHKPLMNLKPPEVQIKHQKYEHLNYHEPGIYCVKVNEHGNRSEDTNINGTFESFNIYYKDVNQFKNPFAMRLVALVQDPKERRSLKAEFLSTQYRLATANKIQGGYLPLGQYRLLIEKIEIHRLPPPYTSNCRAENVAENVFSSDYSQASCVENCHFNSMLSQCGAVIDAWVPYVDPSKKPNSTHVDPHETRKCIDRTWLSHECDCPKACEEVDYIATWEKIKYWKYPRWSIEVRYKTHRVSKISELPLYNLPELLAELGGILGLLAGMSVLTIIELACFFFITIAIYMKRSKDTFVNEFERMNKKTTTRP